MKYIYLFVILFAHFSAHSAESLQAYSKNIENYFNNLTSYQAEFKQYVPGEDVSTGHFYLSPPGKFLWQYTQPVPQKVISTGSQIYYVDEETEQVTQLPSQQGLARLLTKKNFKFDNRFKLVHAQKSNHFIEAQISVEEDGTPLISTLYFTPEPFQLSRLQTTDPLGNDIFIVFSQIEENTHIDSKLFKYTPPHYMDLEF